MQGDDMLKEPLIKLLLAYVFKTRGAGGSIKSRTPAGLPVWGPRPGVERSGTPGWLEKHE
jgi:hypothetical protein